MNEESITLLVRRLPGRTWKEIDRGSDKLRLNNMFITDSSREWACGKMYEYELFSLEKAMSWGIVEK